MNKNFYIDKDKIYKGFAFGLILFLLCGALAIYFGVKYSFISDFSILKFLALFVYCYLAYFWIEESIICMRLARQDEPFASLNDEGILFNCSGKITFVPWSDVIGVVKNTPCSEILIFLNKKYNIMNRTFWQQTVPIDYVVESKQEVYNILMGYKSKFGKSNDPRIEKILKF